MAKNKVKRSVPGAQTRRLDYTTKDRAYSIFQDLYRGFAMTHYSLERLQELNIVPSNHLRPCLYMAQELQGLTNSAFFGVLREAEFLDAGHFEKLRLAIPASRKSSARQG